MIGGKHAGSLNGNQAPAIVTNDLPSARAFANAGATNLQEIGN